MHTELLWCCYWMCLVGVVRGKWVEGHLDTKENWSFLARFCFLSLDGQFEYLIEFDREMGTPNLLLYYDDESQWPSVYHSDKSCKEREVVLNKAGQNQIIPLSHWYPDTEFSGCVVRNEDRELPATKSTTTTIKPALNSTSQPETQNNKRSTEDPAYFNQFLKTTENNNLTTESTHNITWFELPTTAEYNSTITDYPEGSLWENIAPERNESELSNDLKDVEFMFGESDQGKTPKIKRSFEIYDRLKRRRLSAEAKSGASAGERTGKLVVSCHNARRFRSARERWWFIAISNCDSPKGLDVRYKFLMTNGPEGDFWHEHFSADEFYVLPVLLAYALAYILVLIAIAMCSVELKSRHLLHSTYKLFVVSVVAQHAGVVMWCLAQARYAANGVGNEGAKIMGQFLCGISEMTYLLLLVLMAKGYTITRARLKVSFTIKLTVFMCSYAMTYVVLFIYQKHSFDPGAVLYLYESPAGYGLVVLRIVAWFMFVYATVFTIKKYPEKSMFYCPFSICGTLWFYAGPLFILTANSYIDKWVRESVVTAVLLFISFCGHVMFLMLTLPVFANKNFPYHVRTTQIGIMETTGSARFGHGMYRPSDVTHAQTVIIPLTRRTEELIGNMYSQYMASAPPLSLEDESKLNVVPKAIVSSSPRLIQQDSTETNTSEDINPSLSRNENLNNEVSTVKHHAPKSDNISGHNGVTENRLKDVFTVESQMTKLKNEGKETILQNGHGFLEPKISPRNDGFLNANGFKNEYNYEKDPNYIKDVSNPILMSANLRSRRNMLEPIASKDVPPPSWSLAKGPAKPPRKAMLEKDEKHDKTDIEPSQLAAPPSLTINKKVPPVRNGIKQNSGEISTIHEQYEQIAEGASNRATVDLFAAGNHKM